MPTISRQAQEARESYLSDLQGRRYSPVTIGGYRKVIRRLTQTLEDAESDTRPEAIGEQDIKLLLATYSHLLPSTQQWMLTIYSAYLEHYGNNVIRRMRLGWPKMERVHVDWLNPLEAQALKDQAIGVERMLLTLELDHGLRKSEAMRFELRQVGPGYLDVLGKGRMGGKWRRIPFHPSMQPELSMWLEQRENIIARKQRLHPRQVAPDNLLIHSHPRLSAYANTSMDKIIYGLSERTGIRFSHHTLRRTFGRTLWQAGVEIETISKLMGHEDIKTTMRYIGVQMDDMRSAMTKLGEYQQNIISGHHIK